MSETFGVRIKALRTEHGMSLDDLAKMAACSKSYLWELENNDPPRPSAEKLSAIALALGVTVDYLYGRDSERLACAQDKAFFRYYSSLPAEARQKIRAIARVIAP